MPRNQGEASILGRWNLCEDGKATGGKWGTSDEKQMLQELLVSYHA